MITSAQVPHSADMMLEKGRTISTGWTAQTLLTLQPQPACILWKCCCLHLFSGTSVSVASLKYCSTFVLGYFVTYAITFYCPAFCTCVIIWKLLPVILAVFILLIVFSLFFVYQQQWISGLWRRFTLISHLDCL